MCALCVHSLPLRSNWIQDVCDKSPASLPSELGLRDWEDCKSPYRSQVMTGLKSSANGLSNPDTSTVPESIQDALQTEVPAPEAGCSQLDDAAKPGQEHVIDAAAPTADTALHPSTQPVGLQSCAYTMCVEPCLAPAPYLQSHEPTCREQDRPSKAEADAYNPAEEVSCHVRASETNAVCQKPERQPVDSADEQGFSSPEPEGPQAEGLSGGRESRSPHNAPGTCTQPSEQARAQASVPQAPDSRPLQKDGAGSVMDVLVDAQRMSSEVATSP